MDFTQKLKLMTLKSLNEDFIGQLSLEDLKVVSEKCKKLVELADIRAKRISETFTIQEKDGEIIISPIDSYLNCFSRYILNIRIFSMSADMQKKFAQFIQTNCGTNIRNVSLHDCQLSESFLLKVIKNLANVESVDISDYVNKTFPSIEIMKYCPHIKYLRVAHEVTELRRISSSSLNVLELGCLTVANKIEVEKFLKTNSNIKRFVCNEVNYDNMELVKWLLKTVRNTKNIKELFVGFVSTKIDFTVIHDELQALDKRTNFKQLHIKIRGSSNDFIGSTIINPFELTMLNSLVGFDLIDGNNLDEIFGWLNEHINCFKTPAFHNLKYLQLNLSKITKELEMNLTHNFPSLEELHLAPIEHSLNVEMVQTFLCDIIRSASQLTSIFLPKDGIFDKKFIKWLNEERKHLDDAKQLTLFINPSVHEWPEATDDNLVVVKQVEMDYSGWNRSNPFFSFTYKECF